MGEEVGWCEVGVYAHQPQKNKCIHVEPGSSLPYSQHQRFLPEPRASRVDHHTDSNMVLEMNMRSTAE